MRDHKAKLPHVRRLNLHFCFLGGVLLLRQKRPIGPIVAEYCDIAGPYLRGPHPRRLRKDQEY